MGFFEENGNTEVYKNLTKPDSCKINQKWTTYLALCCMTVCLGSFQFGYNIGSLNLVESEIVDFVDKIYWGDLIWSKMPHLKEGLNKLALGIEQYNNGSIRYKYGKNKLFEADLKKAEYLETKLIGNSSMIAEADRKKKEKEEEVMKNFNMTIEEYLTTSTIKLKEGEKKLIDAQVKLREGIAKADYGKAKLIKGRHIIYYLNYVIWGFINSLFVLGGLFGALASKHVMDRFGRKNGIVFHLFFSIAGSIAIFLSSQFVSEQACVYIFDADFNKTLAPSYVGPILLKLGRFLQGIQGGLSCSLIPTYLSEIAPSRLRGQTGVIHNFFLTLGLLTAQLLGFEGLLGNCKHWYTLLALPMVPAVIGVVLLLFFEESPKYLYYEKNDEEAAAKALMKLRDMGDVSAEMEKMAEEWKKMMNQPVVMSVSEVLKARELRWPLLSGILLQMTQQMCGINVVFFYSRAIFDKAGVHPDYIEYFVMLTGLTNVFCTFVCGILVDNIGRKRLLVGSMSLMAVDLFLLTTFIRFSHVTICSVLALFCVVIFIVCFAIGLGPIPYIFVAESFRQNARSSAMSICTFNNWFWNLILVLLFPILLKLLSGYVFVIFTAFVIATIIFVVLAIPETKGKTPDEIQCYFNANKSIELKEDIVV